MPTLNWHKREEAVRAATRAPGRSLEPAVELSYGDADSEDPLIQGDDLDARKALLSYHAGRVRCIALARASGRLPGSLAGLPKRGHRLLVHRSGSGPAGG